MERKLTKGLDWKIAQNLDAFNDVLRGGFGIHEYEQNCQIEWINSKKSMADLSWNETINYIEKKLETCHPSNIEYVKTDLEDVRKRNGQTLWEIINEIIGEHRHIELKLS